MSPHFPRPERVATRTKRAEKAWNDFFAGLDSALLSDISFAYFEGETSAANSLPRLSCGEHSCS